MTASLYQSGRSVGSSIIRGPGGSVRVGGGSRGPFDGKAVGRQLAHPQDVRGLFAGMELDVGVLTLPGVGLVAEQIEHLIGAGGVDTQSGEVEIERRALGGTGIEVDDAQH